MNVTILGAGSFGTALAKLLAENKNDILLWGRNESLVNQINEKNENNHYLPGFKLPPNLRATQDIRESLKNTDLILSVLPTQATRNVIESIKDYIPTNIKIIVCSKGIEQKTHKLVCDIFIDILGDNIKEYLYLLSGPSFAGEIASQMPTAVTLAGYQEERLKELQTILTSPYFRVYGIDDVIGAGLGGSLKNVIALACGASDGLGLGSNTKTALITRGLAEISRLGAAMGAKQATFTGLAGMGDLVLTCTGDLSRNRTVGIRLAQGMSLKEVLGGMKQVAEGVSTTESVYEIAAKKQVSMPITEAVYSVLYKEKPIKEMLKRLMNRDMKLECE